MPEITGALLMLAWASIDTPNQRGADARAQNQDVLANARLEDQQVQPAQHRG